jgi:hypothetical protein
MTAAMNSSVHKQATHYYCWHSVSCMYPDQMNAMVFILTTLMNGYDALADPPQGLDTYVRSAREVHHLLYHSQWRQMGTK